MPKENSLSFDELSLRADVVKMWGEAGAHVEVLDRLIGLEQSGTSVGLNHEGTFVHQCITPGCGTLVQYDDEPCCFKHSPDEGSHLPFYSARERLTEDVTPQGERR